jgi:type IV fimbrial biogenesis protein FimT
MVKPAGGFSLVELMVVVAILGIIMAFAAPNFSEWIATQRVRDTASDLHTSLMRARSEAISRGVSTSICAVNGNLANGWSIPNPSRKDDGTLFNPDPGAPADTTTAFQCTNTLSSYIEQHDAIPNATISGATNVRFSNSGRLVTTLDVPSSTPLAIKITVTGTNSGRCVTVDTAGRPKTRVINASAACS